MCSLPVVGSRSLSLLLRGSVVFVPRVRVGVAGAGVGRGGTARVTAQGIDTATYLINQTNDIYRS